jgi:hypothetical protein
MFLSVVFVWLGSWLAGFGQIFSMNIGVLCHQLQHIAQHLGNLLAQQQCWQQRLQGCVHVGTVDADRFGRVGVVVGGNVLHYRLLRQARDVLEIGAVLEPLQSLLDAPALVVQITERTSRKTHHIAQVGHQNSDLAIGLNVADQPHGLRLAGTLEVADIATLGAAQRDHLFQEPAAQEVPHVRKARVAGFFHSHAKRDAHTAEHQRDQGWQGQLALAGEGVGMFGVGRVQEKFGRTYARGKIDKEREREGACWPMNRKSFGANNLFLLWQVFFVLIFEIRIGVGLDS